MISNDNKSVLGWQNAGKTRLGRQYICGPNHTSGDGGNRTRVRKNRPTEIYERSLPKLVTAGISAGR